MSISIKVTVSAVFAILLSSNLFAETWEKVREKDGITVERVYVKGSSVLKFRGTGVIDSDIVTILAVLQDVKHQSRWNKNSYDNKIVEKTSDSEFIAYSAAKVPWPFQDRDYLVKLKLNIDEKAKLITVSGKETQHPDVPPRSGKVRISLMRTTWVFRPLKEHKGKKTWVQFTVHSDPGGNIPDWLINFISKYIPYKTIVNIRQIIKDEKYDKSFISKYKRFENWY